MVICMSGSVLLCEITVSVVDDTKWDIVVNSYGNLVGYRVLRRNLKRRVHMIISHAPRESSICYI